MIEWFIGACLLCLMVFSTRYAWWRRPVDYSVPRILMYHMVTHHVKDAKFNKLRVRPDAFEKQIRWLVQNDWYFATMSEIASCDSLPNKTVVLTFDDGYEDNFTNAHEILKRYGAKATLYLVVDRFDRDWSSYKHAHRKCGELMREAKLSDSQVKEMLGSGCWELGAHTMTHANLSVLDSVKRRQEICTSRKQLEYTFKVPVETFAYPFGIYEDVDVSLARACGFRTAVTTKDGIDSNISRNPLELRRIKIGGNDNLLGFAIKLKTGMKGAFK